jgi:amino acid adenylation domain-containing protein
LSEEAISELLERLEALDVRIWPDGDQLRFEAPQGRVTGELRAELAAKKTALMQFLRGVRHEKHRPPPICPRPRQARLLPSFAQQRLWFLEQLAPGEALYHIARAFCIKGPLSLPALQRAVDDLVARHEALRTTFVLESGVASQHIGDQTVHIEITDVPNLAHWEEHGALLARRAFDLVGGPLMRVAVFRRGPREHALVLVLHHIVTDGWSMGVLWRELSVLYEARCRGVEAALAPLPVQYADYALWQREWLQGAVLERQLGYWKRALAELPALELPTDRRRPLQPSYRGSRVRFELAPELTQALKALGRAEGATLFMTLLAAFQVLLYRYSGQEDLAVGIPVAGRNRPELEGLIGFFVNTLVLRGDLSGAPSFREYLGRVREGALEAYAHQDLPFEKLVEELAPRRDASRNPLFQVMFVLQNTPREPWQLPGLQVEPLALETHSAKFDLSMELTESDGRLLGVLEYATDLFEAASAERMVGHWRVLLESIVADPGERISHLDLLGEAERRRLLLEWNDTARPYPREACIHALFEAQVERAPGAIAVSCGGQQLTYGELNARANRLAHELRARGVGPDALVALCLERSLELVVALLGILKAGGAYVPLDPSYPAERLAFMLQDTRAPVLITEERLLKALPAFAGHTLCLDRDAARLAQHPASNPEPGAHAHHLAYVIYTSGSTGKPKGVMIEHRSLVNHMLWMQRRFPLSADDRVLQKTPTSADASVWEFFAPLISGARLVLAAPQAERSPPELAAILEREQISVAQFVPSLLASLLQNPGLRNCESLRRVYCGGEMLPREAARRFASQCAAELVNLYGPTEATIDATFHVAGPDDGRSACPGSCSSEGSGSRAVFSGGPSSPPSTSSPFRSPTADCNASTAPAIWCAALRTDGWSTWAARTRS